MHEKKDRVNASDVIKDDPMVTCNLKRLQIFQVIERGPSDSDDAFVPGGSGTLPFPGVVYQNVQRDTFATTNRSSGRSSVQVTLALVACIPVW